MPKEAETADLVQADLASEGVTGDFAVLQARRAELDSVRNGRNVRADIDYKAALLKAATYPEGSKRGQSIIDTATAKRDTEVTEANEMYRDGEAKFALDHDMLQALDDPSRAVKFMGRRLQKVVTASILPILRAASANGTETLDLGNGAVWNVGEHLALYAPVGVVPADTANPNRAPQAAPKGKTTEVPTEAIAA